MFLKICEIRLGLGEMSLFRRIRVEVFHMQ